MRLCPIGARAARGLTAISSRQVLLLPSTRKRASSTETNVDQRTLSQPISRPDQIDALRALNDAFRRTLSGGDVLLTQGVRNLGPDVLADILDLVRSFESFEPGNDPNGDHDFGAFVQDGERLFWKIDYYDRCRRFGSPDPTDASVTTRLVTTMLAEEY